MLQIRALEIADYPEVRELWEASDGVGLSDSDSAQNTARFLARNPGLSLAAVDGAKLVGCVLCGHDGRRGFIHHLVVEATHRRQGVGRALVEHAVRGLREAGNHKCHLLVFNENAAGRAFWKKVGAEQRLTLSTFSISTK